MKVTSINANTTSGYSADTYAGVVPTRDSSTSSGDGISKEVKTVQDKEQRLRAEINKSLEAMQPANTRVERSVHEKTHRIVYKIVDNDSGELVREIPEEKLLDMAAKLMELNGILIDKKV